MIQDTEAVLRAMVEEKLTRGAIDLQRWLAEMPGDREEVVALAAMIEVAPESGDEGPNTWSDHGHVARTAQQRLIERTAARALEQQEKMIAARLPAARAAAAQAAKRGTAKPKFRQAAVLTYTLDKVRGASESASRYVTHKAVYLLEQALQLHLFVEYKKMAAGPYDPGLRYRSAEPIAQQQKWLRIDKNNEQNLVALPAIKSAHRYAARYLGDAELADQLIAYVLSFEPWELETLATVHAAAIELQNTAQPVTVDGIRGVLGRSPTWKAKLAKQNFREDRVSECIARLRRLTLIQDAAPANPAQR